MIHPSCSTRWRIDARYAAIVLMSQSIKYAPTTGVAGLRLLRAIAGQANRLAAPACNSRLFLPTPRGLTARCHLGEDITDYCVAQLNCQVQAFNHRRMILLVQMPDDALLNASAVGGRRRVAWCATLVLPAGDFMLLIDHVTQQDRAHDKAPPLEQAHAPTDAHTTPVLLD